MKRILIIGATSAIAQACARLWVTQGASLYLVGRNAQKLNILEQDLRTRGASTLASESLDLNQLTQHPALLARATQALGGLDIVLIAHGTLSDQAACEHSVELTLQELHTNALSVISLATLLAQQLEAQHSGCLAVISSVAGERGRATNYVYGTAKAALSCFLSGLRQRLHPSGVHVLTIKPGFVDTPMTAEFTKGKLWATPEQVALGIIKAIESGKNSVYLPWFWRYIMLIIQHIPDALFKRLKF